MILNQSGLEILINSVKYGHNNVISCNENYVITKPLNTWDTNYRLYDKKEKMIYLIDRDNVHESEKDLNEFGGILYQDLISLQIEDVKSVAWKTETNHSYYI